MSPTSYQAALPRVIPSLLSATLIIIPYSNSFVKRVRKVFLQRKQRTKTRLPTFFPESQQPRQFTPLREGRRYACPPCRVLRRISIHAPPRGATAARTLPQPLPAFQFTPLREGRRKSTAAPPSYTLFQFTPLREGRPGQKLHRQARKKISIHAPPRGATLQIFRMRPPLAFQFTPLREGRRCPSAVRSHHLHFNSRPSARGDGKANQVCCRLAISIHAPPRGATCPLVMPRRVTMPISIHAPPRGATVLSMGFTKSMIISIHAPPRGATVSDAPAVYFQCSFQFTPLREGRHGRNPRQYSRLISIHAPPRGATRICRGQPVGELISIHAPPRGATRKARERIIDGEISIHAPPRGATGIAQAERPHGMISIHAPPRGATVPMTLTVVPILFQFTPLREGRPVRGLSRGAIPLFQFTPLREGRHSLPACLAYSALISIHAPPRGATSAVYSLSAHALFQFTPLREGRQKVQPALFMISLFQFTPLREGRPPEGRACRRCTTNFNSRPSARGDVAADTAKTDADKFQFTPLREGRRSLTTSNCCPSYFNSRPSARGDETAGSPLHSKVVISIHAPPRGATARFARI